MMSLKSFEKIRQIIGQEAPTHPSHIVTSSYGNIFRVTGPLCGEFTGEFPAQRPVTQSFDVFFDLHLNKRLSEQSMRTWFF